ncbi:hypothetical protein SRABI106_04780 [Rahnella aquatilis]|nr:hypothetical protein SRABI106_04780 [Rahnella aquatilis]
MCQAIARRCFCFLFRRIAAQGYARQTCRFSEFCDPRWREISDAQRAVAQPGIDAVLHRKARLHFIDRQRIRQIAQIGDANQRINGQHVIITEIMLRTQVVQGVDNHVRRAAARVTFGHHAGGFYDVKMGAQNSRNIPARRRQAAKHFQKALRRVQNINASLHVLPGKIRRVNCITGSPSCVQRFDRRAELTFGAGGKTDGIA